MKGTFKNILAVKERRITIMARVGGKLGVLQETIACGSMMTEIEPEERGDERECRGWSLKEQDLLLVW